MMRFRRFIGRAALYGLSIAISIVAGLVVIPPAIAGARTEVYPLLTCRGSGKEFFLGIAPDGSYHVRLSSGQGRSTSLQFKTATEYVNTTQEPSFFLQLTNSSRMLQIYFDSLLLDTHRSIQGIKLRYKRGGGSSNSSYDCRRLKFDNAPLRGKKSGVNFVRVWNLGYEGYANSINEYDSNKYGVWL